MTPPTEPPRANDALKKAMAHHNPTCACDLCDAFRAPHAPEPATLPVRQNNPVTVVVDGDTYTRSHIGLAGWTWYYMLGGKRYFTYEIEDRMLDRIVALEAELAAAKADIAIRDAIIEPDERARNQRVTDLLAALRAPTGAEPPDAPERAE